MEMAYCGPRGIPHGHFLGGPNEWTQLDRDKALWWSIHEAQKCSSCGTRDEEWDPAQGGSIHAYRAESHICWGCVTTAAGEKAQGSALKPGQTIRLVGNT
jgi:hypothetical protein